MKNQSDQIALLHLKWQELTKLNRPFNCADYFPWELWLSRGYTSADLELVVGYIWKRIKEGQRQKESFKLSNLLEPSRLLMTWLSPDEHSARLSPALEIRYWLLRADLSPRKTRNRSRLSWRGAWKRLGER